VLHVLLKSSTVRIILMSSKPRDHGEHHVDVVPLLEVVELARARVRKAKASGCGTPMESPT
jgi:hypothetical protein